MRSYVDRGVSAVQDTFWNLIFSLHGIPQSVPFRYNAQTDKIDFMTSIQTRLEVFGIIAESVVLPTYGGGRMSSYHGGYTISNQQHYLTALRVQAIRRDMLDPRVGVPVQVVVDQLKMKRKQDEKLQQGLDSNESTNGDY
jgi:hypothetical protein